MADIFLLRAPSEATPCARGAHEPADGAQSCPRVSVDELRLRLDSRGNAPSGTELARGCGRACPAH
eukprot:6390631-Pyramimonas_sp.AAC.1